MQDEKSQSMMVGTDEISLIDIFKVLNKKKNLIILMTMASTFIALGISFLLPRVYEVSTIVSPASRPVTDGQGQIVKKQLIETPLSIKEAITGGSYDQALVSKLQLVEMELPKITVVVPKDTDLVKISIKTSAPEVGVALAEELISLLSSQQSQELHVERQQIENRLKLHLINLQTKKSSLDLFNKQFKDSKAKIDSLENVRQNKISKANDAVAVLLYSNEIKTHQLYLNNLEEKIQALSGDIASQKIIEDQLALKKELLKPLEVVKMPTIPVKPVSPRKSLITILGFLLGAFGGIILAFLFELFQKVKNLKISKIFILHIPMEKLFSLNFAN